MSDKRTRNNPNPEPLFDISLECGCVKNFRVPPSVGEELYCYRHPDRYQAVTKKTRLKIGRDARRAKVGTTKAATN